jgi:predicted RNA-binding Zn-ribbon protein involved in translation (DUF1610 family)
MSLTNDNASQPPSMLRAWFALHHCPACGSGNVRRSTLRGREVGAYRFHSPYRCRECNERFWVVSRGARVAAVVAVGCGLCAALLVAFLIVAPPEDDADVGVAAPNERGFEERTVPTVRAPAPPAPPVPASASEPPAATPTPASSSEPPATLPATAGQARSEARPLRPPAQPFVK